MTQIDTHRNSYSQEQCFHQEQQTSLRVDIVRRMADDKNQIFFVEWRRFAGFSQEELSYRMGYSRSAVAKAETRPYNVTLAFLAAFAEAVGAPSVRALFREPEGNAPMVDQLFHFFQKITDEKNRETVLQVAKGFAGESPTD